MLSDVCTLYWVWLGTDQCPPSLANIAESGRGYVITHGCPSAVWEPSSLAHPTIQTPVLLAGLSLQTAKPLILSRGLGGGQFCLAFHRLCAILHYHSHHQLLALWVDPWVSANKFLVSNVLASARFPGLKWMTTAKPGMNKSLLGEMNNVVLFYCGWGCINYWAHKLVRVYLVSFIHWAYSMKFKSVPGFLYISKNKTYLLSIFVNSNELKSLSLTPSPSLLLSCGSGQVSLCLYECCWRFMMTGISH